MLAWTSLLSHLVVTVCNVDLKVVDFQYLFIFCNTTNNMTYMNNVISGCVRKSYVSYVMFVLGLTESQTKLFLLLSWTWYFIFVLFIWNYLCSLFILWIQCYIFVLATIWNFCYLNCLNIRMKRKNVYKLLAMLSQSHTLCMNSIKKLLLLMLKE